MTKQHFSEALQIIATYHTSHIIINKPAGSFVNSNIGTTEFTIHITICCASVVENLRRAGYSLSMSENGLSVNKY